MKRLILFTLLFTSSIQAANLGWGVLLVDKLTNTEFKNCLEEICDVIEYENELSCKKITVLETINIVTLPPASEELAQNVANIECVDFVRELGVLHALPRVIKSNR